MTNASIIIASRDRHAVLAESLSRLLGALRQTECEVLLVDDGSTPALKADVGLPVPTRLLRANGVGRSAARNLGVRSAVGALLIFLDDDITVCSNFVREHLDAHSRLPGVLAVGDIRLPPETQTTPFGRFRQRLEESFLADADPERMPQTFCASGNMSMARDQFLVLGGFDEELDSAEDQDLALRHSAAGGRIVFVPAARAIHRDTALDISSYCRRVEWGAAATVPFCRKHPDLPDNVDRQRINGPERWGREAVTLSVKKTAKRVFGLAPFTTAVFALAAVLERWAPAGGALDSVYRALLGIHIQRGYRRGLKRSDCGICSVGPR